MKKWIIRAIGVFLLLLLATAMGGYLYMDSLARAAIEHGAKQATGVQTTVQQVNVRPIAGTISLSKLKMDNPPAFSGKGSGGSGSPFLELGQGRMQVSVMSLLGQTVDVKKLSLNHINLNLVRQNGKSNYQAILSHMKKHAGEPKSGKKYIIHQLDVTHVKVTLIGFPGGKQTFELPAIHLSNIGNADGAHGMRMSDLTGVVIQTIFTSLIKHPEKLPNVLVLTLGQSIQSLGQAGASLVSDTIKTLGHTAGDTVSTLTGGLLGTNHKKDSNTHASTESSTPQ